MSDRDLRAVVHPRGTVELQRHGDVRAEHEPVHTVRAGGQHHGLLVAANRANNVPQLADVEASPPVLTGGTLAVISHYTGRGDLAGGVVREPSREPISTVTASDKHSVVVPYQSAAVRAGEQPAATVTTVDRLALVVPHASGNEPRIAEREPSSTVTTHAKQAVVWTDDDIDRCRFRMFDLSEIAGAMAMARHHGGGAYEVLGNKRERMAQYDGGLFSSWLLAMDALGYEHEIVWLNSMFAHVPGVGLVPQSRDRMYPVFWLKGARRPDLRVEPLSWCPSCERVVHGVQTFKRPGLRVWGRYGPQYFYRCPDCRGAALPGAAPAATIIDESIPAQVIGERSRPLAANTRERIRRGLQRLEDEPFAIRLTHGGAPRPLTLPLVTLTQRHDPAVVLPVAGNTYERSPGNRARRADKRPLDTVHGTLDRAMVVPPMGGVEPRPAATAPAPTQTTTTRAAVVDPEAIT